MEKKDEDALSSSGMDEKVNNLSIIRDAS